MGPVLRTMLFFLFLILPAVSCATMSPQAVEIKEAFEAAKIAEGQPAGDYELIDQDGVRFRLSDYFKTGKPLVVSFIYTSCPTVCPTITSELKKALDEARGKFGDRFSALTIGFDTENDTPKNLKEYGERFVADFNEVRFATSDAETIKALTGRFGFYVKKQAGGSFDHLDMVTVVKPDGTIYRHVYSLRTQPQNLVGRLDEAITGKPSNIEPSLMDRIKLLCYRYDARTGTYVVDYQILLSVGVQTVAVVALAVYLVWGRKIRARFKRER